MTNQTLRVGFVGAGKNTRERHIPGFQKLSGIDFVAVANRTKESGERVAKEFGIRKVYADWRELVRAPDIDAVCIGTWPNMHPEITVAALEAGKHVLCEARMAMSAAAGRPMLEASRRAPHLVAQLVPAPHTLEVDSTLKSLLAEGYAGEVLAVELQAAQGRFVEPDAPLHWRQDITLSGHNVLNMGIWYEAMMRWLGPARRVTVTALAPPSEAWIFGSEGTLRLEADARRLSGGRRGDRALSEIQIPAERRIGWRVEEEFVNAVRGREKVTHTTFEDGVRYMEFTDAVAGSAASGRTVDVAPL